MSHRNSSPPISPLFPTDSMEEIAMVSRHDSINSAQGLEIAELKRKVKELQGIEGRLERSHDQLSQELKICQSDLAKEKQEARKFAGKLSKESRNFKVLGEEMATLRQDTERKVRDLETQLDREKKKRIKEHQGAQKTITELQSQLDAKQSKMEELEVRFTEKKRHFHATEAEIEATRATAHRPPTSSLACKLNTDEPGPIQSTLVPKLHDTIKYLQKENARLHNIHHEDGCEEYRELIFQQLGDAKDLQAAAEAETEGLRHLAKANADLIDDHAIDVECIKELIQEKDRYRIEAEQLEETVSELRVEQHLTSGVVQGTEVANPAPQPLGLSGVAYLCTAPIAPEDSKAETAEYMHRLRVAELEVESLTSEKHSLSLERAEMKAQLVSNMSKLNTREQQPKFVLELSAVVCLASEPELASSSKGSLTFSDRQTVSITPRMPTPATTSLTNPDLLSHLEELGKSIMSLSNAPPPKAVMKPATKLQITPFLPNIGLTINIQPTGKRNYSLLQRVQSAISATSSLDIHGPKEVVKQFVASMHDVETDHAEKSKLVIQLDKAAKQHHADIEALEAQLRDKRKCSDPEHRMLADELEAKNVQFAMQAQLLADWRRRNV